MWRLSRLQNLAISPLATILLCENLPPSEQDWGVTEHPENGTGSHCGNCRNRLFTALRLWHWRREPADKLTARSPLTAQLPEVGGSRHLPAGEEILNEGKAYTRQTHTHSQAYQMQARALHEGGRNAFAAFHYNPKAWVRLSERFWKGIWFPREKAERLLSSKPELGFHTMVWQKFELWYCIMLTVNLWNRFTRGILFKKYIYVNMHTFYYVKTIGISFTV